MRVIAERSGLHLPKQVPIIVLLRSLRPSLTMGNIAWSMKEGQLDFGPISGQPGWNCSVQRRRGQPYSGFRHPECPTVSTRMLMG
jgi:hypothetical protein